MERGWQLMWLCTGLFPPSPALMSHARRFLESRATDPLAADCLQRLRQMTRSGSKLHQQSQTRDFEYSACVRVCVCVCVSNISKEPRRFSPDLVELVAIQQNSTRVFHKVHFPNETSQV